MPLTDDYNQKCKNVNEEFQDADGLKMMPSFYAICEELDNKYAFFRDIDGYGTYRTLELERIEIRKYISIGNENARHKKNTR